MRKCWSHVFNPKVPTEFKRKREEIALAKAMEKKEAKKAERARKKRKRKAMKSKLSFQDDDDFVELEEDAAQKSQKGPSSSTSSSSLGKDPTIDTTFLPDKERDEKEKAIRLQLAAEWKEEQERIKAEEIVVIYSYWDGKGSRRAQKVKKGSTIGEFLGLVREAVEDLHGVATCDIMFVKADMILPHHYTFHELITTKARGKSGMPLFRFDVNQDIRIRHDATVASQESHPVKVLHRRWYEKNRHIFPASRWEVYSP